MIRRWKFSQKLLSPWEQLIYEKIPALDLLGPRDKFLLIAENLSNKPCGPWKNVSWSLSCSKKWEKVDQNLSFTGKFAFFPKKNVFSTFQQPRRSWRIDIITNKVTMKKPWRPLQTVLWGLSHLKKGATVFFLTGKFAFFFKKLCFQQPLKSWRNDLFTYTVIVRKPFLTFINCSRRFVTIDITKKC